MSTTPKEAMEPGRTPAASDPQVSSTGKLSTRERKALSSSETSSMTSSPSTPEQGQNTKGEQDLTRVDPMGDSPDSRTAPAV